MIIKVYPITEQEAEQLMTLNTDTIIFLKVWYEPVGFAIEERTLEDPTFIAYKNMFDTFPPRQPVDVDINVVPFSY